MKTILIIDDDASVRMALAGLLRRQNWRVLEAGEGQQGIELARQHLPHAILCDLLMPGTSGFRVCSTIRNDRTLRHALLIAMSGRGFEDNRRSAMDAGADEFLVKPIEAERLLSMLDAVAPAPPPGAPAAPTIPSARGRTGRSLTVRFWGVRGSVPVPGPATVRYGGNTACVEVRHGEEILILDAGTGLRGLGEALSAEFGDGPLEASLLVTHAHWDHVQGLPFFKPVYSANTQLRILGFEAAGETLATIFSRQMEPPFFPIALSQLQAHLRFEELQSMDFKVSSVSVSAAFVNHPGICVGYRLHTDQGAVAYVPDHEPFQRGGLQAAAPGVKAPPGTDAQEFARGEDRRILEFLRGVDALILDSQFDTEEYPSHRGWGHSSVDDAVDLAVRAQARRLYLFHHDPTHDDDRIDAMVERGRHLAKEAGSDLEVHAAREGLAVELAAVPMPC